MKDDSERNVVGTLQKRGEADVAPGENEFDSPAVWGPCLKGFYLESQRSISIEYASAPGVPPRVLVSTDWLGIIIQCSWS